MKFKFTLVTLVIILQLNLILTAQNVITFQKLIGGIGAENALDIIQNQDSSYVICGFTSSFGNGSADAYLVKIEANGQISWSKTYGGIYDDGASNITKGINDELLISGYQAGADSYYDAYFFGVDNSGDTLWSKSYGNMYTDYGRYIHQFANGSYAIAGIYADTTSGNLGGNNQMFLAKILPDDSLEWSYSYGSGISEAARKIIKTNDEGFLMVGYTDFYGAGGTDMYVVKTDANGVIQWNKSIGGAGNSDMAESVVQLSDSSYVICGMTNSFGAGNADIYVVRIAHDGTLIWSKTFGGTNVDMASSICVSHDNNIIIAGSTRSFGVGLYDIYLIKIAENGNLLWSNTFGGAENDFGNSVIPTLDGGYIITGQTRSFNVGNYDMYIIKTDSLGNSFCNELQAATLSNTGAIENIGGNRNIGGVLTIPSLSIATGAADSTLCQIITKIESIPEIKYMQIAPNPSLEIFNFEFNMFNANTNMNLEITNILGQPILSMQIDEKRKEINLKQIAPKGVYFASVINSNGNIIEMHKIILQ